MNRLLVVSTPLSIGDIVGRSFRIFRQHPLLIGKTLALPTIILTLGRIAILVGFTFGTKTFGMKADSWLWIGVAVAGAITMLVGAIYFWIRQMALTRFLLGYAESYKEGREFVKGRIWSLIGLWLTSVVATVAVSLVWVIISVVSIPGLKGQGIVPVFASVGLAVSILGVIGSVLLVSVITHLSLVALALEKGELGHLIAKCSSLTVHAFARSLVFLTVTIATIMLISYPLCIPTTILVFGYMMVSGAMTGTPDTNVPLWIQIFNSVWESVVNMIVGPIFYLSYGLFFTDLCMRQEGVDLIDRLDQVEAGDEAKRLSSSGY